MSLIKKELLQDRVQNPFPGIVPGNQAGAVQTKTFDAATGAPTYKVGTPMVLNAAGELVAWQDTNEPGGAAATPIVAFVYPRDVTVDATNEVLGDALFYGKIRYADVLLPSGETQGLLDTALRDPELRKQGIFVDGLSAKD